MEEIILVTDCDLTGSWKNIAFLREWADAQVLFGVNVNIDGPNTSINFQFLPEHALGAVLRNGPEGYVYTPFIRGFRIALSLWFFPKLLKATGGPSPDPRQYDCNSDMEVI